MHSTERYQVVEVLEFGDGVASKVELLEACEAIQALDHGESIALQVKANKLA